MDKIIAMTIIVGLSFLIFVMVSQIQKSANPCGGFAKIILSDLLNDIRGSIGAHVYSVWRGVHYIREKAASISNPNSGVQEMVRLALSVASARWSSTLTPAQRALWNELAQRWGSAAKENSSKGYKDLMPSLGRNMSGYNAFVRAAVLNSRVGIAVVDDAPMGVDMPKPPLGLSITPDGPPITKLDIAWTDPVDMGAADKIGVWVEVVGIAHKQIIDAVAKAGETAPVVAVRGANGDAIGLPIGLYRFQLATNSEFGMRSAGGRIVEYNKLT